MKERFYLNGKRISKNAAIELLGKERFDNRLNEAKEAFYKDPYEYHSWMDGFSILFEQ